MPMRRRFMNNFKWSFDADSAIMYTSSDGRIVVPFNTTVFGANIVSNRYFTGQGIITFDRHITSIGEGAFEGCTSLTSITIPNSVTEIGVFAFSYCRNLTSMTIPDSVTTIGRGAFHNCSRLTSITIGDSVTTIGSHAFYGCDDLTSITIPDSVTEIGNHAFYACENLTSVYCMATTPPTLNGDLVFHGNGSGRKIYVPMESVDAYKSAENWSEYASNIVSYNF